MRELPRNGLPQGVTLEKEGRNLDSLTQTETLATLKKTLVHEWNLRQKFAGVSQFGIHPTKLALFHGPPGNGKTMAAKMLAKATGTILYRVSCEGLFASHLGEIEKNMGAVMKFLESAGPCVVLFDECESIFRARGATEGSCANAISNTMMVFWQYIDRWETPQLFLLATNLIDQLDPALISRCELSLEFGPPTIGQAQQVLAYWEEVLHEYGAEKWGKSIRDKLNEGELPPSFRALWQKISRSVRAHIIAQG